MKYAAITVDDRWDIAQKAVEEHGKFLPDDWSVFSINSLDANTHQKYNAIMTYPNFWEGLEMFDRVLIFQHDSRLLRAGIEEFLQYDYIGAPIKNIPGCMNGGLSLRNPNLMYNICKEHPYRGMATDGNEDIYFSRHSPDVPLDIAKRFSVETIFGLGSLGYHAIDKYLSPEQCNQIRCQYK